MKAAIHGPLRVAIACGGTGGHLFPGLAIAQELKRRDCSVTLLVSPKEVDQTAVEQVREMDIETLPAIGLTRGRTLSFLRGFVRSCMVARQLFKSCTPQAVLAMGGFTSAPPVMVGRQWGVRTFLHESNTIPGRANRWLSRIVSQAFVGFPEAASRLRCKNVEVTGTPVRPQFTPSDPASCRRALNLDPERPVLLVMGGSQGARGINELVLKTALLLAKVFPQLQWFHLSGAADAQSVKAGYAACGVDAAVYGFFGSMELALGAATVAISRAGASSLAELAATRVPSILIPFPAATDNHQFHNAKALVDTGAALLVPQSEAEPGTTSRLLLELLRDSERRRSIQTALEAWHRPEAAMQIAQSILRGISASYPGANHVKEPAQRRAGRGKSDIGPSAPGLDQAALHPAPALNLAMKKREVQV